VRKADYSIVISVADQGPPSDCPPALGERSLPPGGLADYVGGMGLHFPWSVDAHNATVRLYETVGGSPQVSSEERIVVVGEVAHELAVRIFAQEFQPGSTFRSGNPRLMEAIYLPNQLAQDGDGVFFDERIEDRLRSLGVVPAGADIVLVEDLGGWTSIHTLDARVGVRFVDGDQWVERVLIGSALAPAPPVTIRQLEEEYRRRDTLFAAARIPTTVLLIERGVLYHLASDPLPTPIPESIVEQLGELGARLDSLALGKHSFRQLVGPFDIGIGGDPIDVAQDLSAFGLLADRVVWSDVRRRVDDLVGDPADLPGRAYSVLRGCLLPSDLDVFARNYHAERKRLR
jgi:hypothetical protein